MSHILSRSTRFNSYNEQGVAALAVAFLGVDVTPTAQRSYYELTSDTGVVGDIWISAPAKAKQYSLSSVPLAPGGPPSVEIDAFVTGVPVGLLGIQFSPDPWAYGDYEIAISMRGGNEKTLYVSVPKPRGHGHGHH